MSSRCSMTGQLSPLLGPGSRKNAALAWQMRRVGTTWKRYATPVPRPRGLWRRPAAMAGVCTVLMATLVFVNLVPALPRDGFVPVDPLPPNLGLAAAIRPHYARVPGGFGAAIRAARLEAEANPLYMFPRLRYDLLGRDVQIEVLEGEDADLATLGRYDRRRDVIQIRADVQGSLRQIVLEHELTHAWQFAGQAHYNAHSNQPLGQTQDHLQGIWRAFASLGRSNHGPVEYVRGYLARPIEIDPRAAAFKRWWARRHGQVLDNLDDARSAIDRSLRWEVPVDDYDAREFLRLWQSYDNQPYVQKLLLKRLLQLVAAPAADANIV